MPVRTQLQIAEQMVSQIRLLNSSISAEVDTPERLILDTVANAIAEDSIDLVGLQEALNIDTKFGVNLTNFLSIFGFARQEATKATGFVVFSLNAASNRTIQIPKGTLVKAPESSNAEGFVPEYLTTTAAFIRPGETESPAIPIEATRPGSFANVEANKVTSFLSPNIGPLLGVSNVTNPAAISHGSDREDDNSLKVRFKNTVFRNLAGTEDQFLALAIATAFTTKANVVGPVSTYQEYVQVPQNEEAPLEGDDSTSYRFGSEGGEPYPGFPAPVVVRGSTVEGSAILTLSSTAGIAVGQTIVVYEEGSNPKAFITTFKVNEVKSATEVKMDTVAPKTANNVWVAIGTTSSATYKNKWTTGLSTNPYIKYVFPELSVFISTEASGISKRFFREGADFNFNYPPKLQGDTYRALIDATGNDPREGEGAKQPNVTFINVYTGAEPSAVDALAPGSVALLEYHYTSLASRNDPEHNVTNAVDVFIDGEHEQQTSTVFTPPVTASEFEFKDEPANKYHYENYRRAGEPTKRPVIENHVLTQLFNVPVLDIPNQIIIGTDVFYRNIHYWLVKDVSGLGNTIRARDGIEWSNLPADKAGEKGKPTTKQQEERKRELKYEGKKFSELTHESLIELENYVYDANVGDLQVALEGSRQITTDVLAHTAKKRYFKLDVTVVYSSKSSQPSVNEEIQAAVANFLSNQYFGNVLRLSDLLSVIHNVSGVENVRWSNDVPKTRDFVRVFETDKNGLPLRGVFTERIRTGFGQKPIDALYVVGKPTAGWFGLEYTKALTPSTANLKVTGLTEAGLKTAINTWLEPLAMKVEAVTKDNRTTTNVRSSIESFRIEYNKAESLIEPVTVYNPEHLFENGEYVYDADIYLHDDELPALPTGTQKGDTVPGLIIRPRAQNVFEKG